jgi:hypothetical protein
MAPKIKEEISPRMLSVITESTLKSFRTRLQSICHNGTSQFALNNLAICVAMIDGKNCMKQSNFADCNLSFIEIFIFTSSAANLFSSDICLT